MTKEEIITELEYLIQRGVPNSVAIVLHTLVGALRSDMDAILAGHVGEFAKVARDILKSKGQN